MKTLIVFVCILMLVSVGMAEENEPYIYKFNFTNPEYMNGFQDAFSFASAYIDSVMFNDETKLDSFRSQLREYNESYFNLINDKIKLI